MCDQPAYLRGIIARDDRSLPEEDRFPFNLEWLEPNFELQFQSPVTFFVGENGSGKSTLLETIAVLSGLPAVGGSRMEIGNQYAPPERTELAKYLRPWFAKRPKDSYFFRAESQAHLASLLDHRDVDPDFILPGGGKANPYDAYGGRSLHTRSHGEAFLTLMSNRFREGLFLMDEPESALSPQRQLSLLSLIWKLAEHNKSQFIIATHSSIILTFPGATLLSFDDERIVKTTLEETSHYQITKGILANPEMYWQHLRD